MLNSGHLRWDKCNIIQKTGFEIKLQFMPVNLDLRTKTSNLSSVWSTEVLFHLLLTMITYLGIHSVKKIQFDDCFHLFYKYYLFLFNVEDGLQ